MSARCEQRLFWWVGIGLLSCTLAACGAASRIGASGDGTTSDATNTSETRTVSGSLAGSSSANLATVGSKSASSSSSTLSACYADGVVATDADGNTVTSEVDNSCRFSLTLQVGTAYVISFTSAQSFVATLIFSDSAGTTSTLTPGSGSGEITLGAITLSGTVASAADNPAAQNDQDGDGIADAHDDDRNGNGTPDALEHDCSTATESANDPYGRAPIPCREREREHAQEDDENSARIFRVEPWNGRHHVALYKRVRAFVNCAIDHDSVTSATFRIVSEDGDDVPCAFRFLKKHLRGDRVLERITCRHFDDPFLLDTHYIATVDGLRCRDGREIPARSWRWVTRAGELDDDQFGSSMQGDAEDVESDIHDQDQQEGETP